MARRVMRIAALLGLWLGSISRPALAEPFGRLSYERGAGAEACPDEGALRRAVAARLGEDPFDSALPRTFRLAIVSKGARLHGSVELLDGGVAEGRRELEADAEACAELVEAMALAVSLTINPNLVVEVPPTAASAEPAPPEPPPPAPTPVMALGPAPPSPPRDAPPAERRTPSRGAPLVLGTGFLAHGALGSGPGVAAGASALVRAGTSRWSLGLEGRVDALSQAGIGSNGHVYSTLVAGVLAPCLRYGSVSGCPLLLLGSLFAHSRGVRVERSDSGFFAAAGGRLGASAPLAENLLLEARIDALYALTPVTIELDGTPVWQARASGALGVGVVWEFP